MRRISAKLTAALGLATALTLVVRPVAAKEAADMVPTYSFSGAFLAGQSAERANDFTNAIAYFQKALAFDPGNQQLKQSLMLALISNGSFDEALPYARELKKVPKVERFSRLALAIDAFRKTNYNDAGNWLDLVDESDLDSLITGVMTGWAEAGEGDTKAALETIDGMDGPDWYTLFVNYHHAMIAAYAGRKEEAVRQFEEVVGNVAAGGAAPETYMRATEAYARYLAHEGETDKALGVLDAADQFITGRAAISSLREDLQAGKKVSKLIATPSDGASEILLNLATALSRGGGADSFVRLYLHYALALRPNNDEVLTQLASIAEQQKQQERAIDYYKRVQADSPLKAIANLQIGLNLADLDRSDEAIEKLKAAVAANPNDMRAYVALGSVYGSKKNYKASAELYDRAVEHIKGPDKTEWNIFYQRGIAYERLKQWDKAEPDFKKALDLYPNQPQVLNYLGYSWVDRNIHLEEGLKLIQTAVDLRPSDGYIVDSLGWAYYRLGRYDDAVKQLERAVSLKPGDSILNDHLGDAYWRVGRKLEATFQWSQAGDLEPDTELLASVRKKLKEGLPPVKDTEVSKDTPQSGTAGKVGSPGADEPQAE